MYETNLTEYGDMPYPPFDNTSPLVLQGYINGTDPVNFTTTGYVNAVVEVRGLDIIMEIAIAVLVIMLILLGLAVWNTYLNTFRRS